MKGVGVGKARLEGKEGVVEREGRLVGEGERVGEELMRGKVGWGGERGARPSLVWSAAL